MTIEITKYDYCMLLFFLGMATAICHERQEEALCDAAMQLAKTLQAPPKP